MSIYLEENPPAISQFRNPRRAAPTGAIVVHTAESLTDTIGADTGAEAVARFISTRTTFGSYHSIADSDSTVRVGRYEWEMFGEGTGGNKWALHLSFACQASQWSDLPSAWVTGAITNGAAEAAAMAAWVKATVAVTVPARRITAAEYRAGKPGFISHAELDPGRRSDPGPEFPWDAFLNQFAINTNQSPEDPNMPTPKEFEDYVEAIQGALVAAKIPIGNTGPDNNGIDRDLGPATVAGVQALGTEVILARTEIANRLDELATQRAELDATTIELAAVRAQLADATAGGDLPADVAALAAIGRTSVDLFGQIESYDDV